MRFNVDPINHISNLKFLLSNISRAAPFYYVKFIYQPAIPVITSCTYDKVGGLIGVDERVTYTMNIDPGSYDGQLKYGWNDTRAEGFSRSPNSSDDKITITGSFKTTGSKIMVASVGYLNQRIDKDCDILTVGAPSLR